MNCTISNGKICGALRNGQKDVRVESVGVNTSLFLLSILAVVCCCNVFSLLVYSASYSTWVILVVVSMLKIVETHVEEFRFGQVVAGFQACLAVPSYMSLVLV